MLTLSTGETLKGVDTVTLWPAYGSHTYSVEWCTTSSFTCRTCVRCEAHQPMYRSPTLDETEIHKVLSNGRRRQVLQHLGKTPGRINVWELSRSIAEAETNASPPPEDLHKSVYSSLHQTHLPKLQEMGIVEYDQEENAIELREGARDVRVYMEVVSKYGVTWAEFYQLLGTLSLFTVIAALADVPVISNIDPLLLASFFLTIVGASTAYQLWTNRWAILRQVPRW